MNAMKGAFDQTHISERSRKLEGEQLESEYGGSETERRHFCNNLIRGSRASTRSEAVNCRDEGINMRDI